MSNSETPGAAVRRASLSFTISQSLLRLMPAESVASLLTMQIAALPPVLKPSRPSPHVSAGVSGPTNVLSNMSKLEDSYS